MILESGYRKWEKGDSNRAAAASFAVSIGIGSLKRRVKERICIFDRLISISSRLSSKGLIDSLYFG